MKYIRTALLIFLFAISFNVSIADTTDFTISVKVANDYFPPTTPGPLVITTVTDTQIDISWGASTDDIQVAGYQVFRDTLQIATTTLTSYADTGLTPTTTYTYNVVAFDTSLKFSSSSNYVSTTTLATYVPPPPPVDEDDQGGSSVGVSLLSFSIVPNYTSVLMTWETDKLVRYTLRWGETSSYELGFVTSQEYKKKQQTEITDLEPNTSYSYELIAYGRSGNRIILSQGTFKTLALPDVTPPPNVAVFAATAQNNDVLLTWRNPSFDFAKVRIVRSPLFYPTDPFDGYVVYEGVAEEFFDNDALLNQPTQYYTAFVYDEAGNRSSGAIAVAGVQEVTQIDTTPTTDATSTATSTGSSIASISFDDIVIIQSGEIIKSVSGSYLIDTTIPFTISAPYDIFPEHLKAIRITITNPLDTSITYSYLLRVNADKTAYEALITDLGFSGTIPIRLSVYDFQTTEQLTTNGSLISQNIEPMIEVVKNVGSNSNVIWLSMLGLLVLALWLLGKLRGKDEDNQPVRFA